MKINELNALANNFVGDNQKPNVFFVTENSDVTMITVNFDAAYDYWCALSQHIETTLEDRQWGVICSTEPFEDGGKELRTYDDSEEFRGMVA